MKMTSQLATMKQCRVKNPVIRRQVANPMRSDLKRNEAGAAYDMFKMVISEIARVNESGKDAILQIPE